MTEAYIIFALLFIAVVFLTLGAIDIVRQHFEKTRPPQPPRPISPEEKAAIVERFPELADYNFYRQKISEGTKFYSEPVPIDGPPYGIRSYEPDEDPMEEWLDLYAEDREPIDLKLHYRGNYPALAQTRWRFEELDPITWMCTSYGAFPRDIEGFGLSEEESLLNWVENWKKGRQMILPDEV